jgi:hypothetical protein
MLTMTPEEFQLALAAARREGFQEGQKRQELLARKQAPHMLSGPQSHFDRLLGELERYSCLEMKVSSSTLSHIAIPLLMVVQEQDVQVPIAALRALYQKLHDKRWSQHPEVLSLTQPGDFAPSEVVHAWFTKTALLYIMEGVELEEGCEDHRAMFELDRARELSIAYDKFLKDDL